MDDDYEPPVDPDDMEEERGQLASDDEEDPPLVGAIKSSAIIRGCKEC